MPVNDYRKNHKRKNEFNNPGRSPRFDVMGGKNFKWFLPGHEWLHKGTQIWKYFKPMEKCSDGSAVARWGRSVAGLWLDKQHKQGLIYPTNISPLWTGCFGQNNTNYFVFRVLKYLNETEIIENEDGVPTTMMESEEQWDQPNACPPLQ